VPLGQKYKKKAGGTRKTEDKVTQKRHQKGKQEVNEKNDELLLLLFLMNFHEKMYFKGYYGFRRPILLYFTMNSRVPKGRKMTANVAKTIGKP